MVQRSFATGMLCEHALYGFFVVAIFMVHEMTPVKQMEALGMLAAMAL